MKIFISWSGSLSEKIALALKEWFPLIINSLNPFVSSVSIDKGKKWEEAISKELENSEYGIICLTKDNLDSKWILYEAGALSKNLKKSKVSCILFDGLNHTDIDEPLSIFQNTEYNKNDFLKLIMSINKSIGDNGVGETNLSKIFEKWWPDLESKIKNISDEYFPKPITEKKQEILHEILRTSKYISTVVSRFNFNLPKDSLDIARYTGVDEIKFAGKGFNHPVKITINPITDEDGSLKEIIITKKGLEIKEAKNIKGRGVMIDILFCSEESVFWSIQYHFHKGSTFAKSEFVQLEEKEADLLRFKPIWRD